MILALLTTDHISPSEAKSAVKTLIDFRALVSWIPQDADAFGPDIDRLLESLQRQHRRHRKTHMPPLKRSKCMCSFIYNDPNPNSSFTISWKGSNKGGKDTAVDLASFADVTDVWVMLEQHFSNDVGHEDRVDITRAAVQETDNLFGHADLGVKQYSGYNDKSLDDILGLVQGRPILFNHTRYDDPSLNFWDNAESSPSDASSCIHILQLLWHQKVGLARMIDHFWSTALLEPGTSTGIILADEVGLGKTAQVMAFIAFTIERRASQLEGCKILTPFILSKSLKL